MATVETHTGQAQGQKVELTWQFGPGYSVRLRGEKPVNITREELTFGPLVFTRNSFLFQVKISRIILVTDGTRVKVNALTVYIICFKIFM